MIDFQFLHKLLGGVVVQRSVYLAQVPMSEVSWAARLETIEEEERGITHGSMDGGVVGKGQSRQPFSPVRLGASNIGMESNLQSLILLLHLSIMLWVM